MINMTLRHFFQLNAAIQQAAFNIFHMSSVLRYDSFTTDELHRLRYFCGVDNVSSAIFPCMIFSSDMSLVA